MLTSKQKRQWAIGLAVPGICLVVALVLLVPTSIRPSGAPAHRIAVDIALLDNYPGYYQWQDDDLITVVTREGDHLYQEYSTTAKREIFLRDVSSYRVSGGNDVNTFGIGSDGHAESLIITNAGQRFVAPRINPVLGQQLFAEQRSKQRKRSPTPGSALMLRHLILSLLAGVPDYQSMSDDLARRWRSVYADQRDVLQLLGAVHDIQFIGVGINNDDIFLVTQDNEYTEWHINLSADGHVKLLDYESRRPHRVPM